KTRRESLRQVKPLLAFFCLIGLGFMFIEMCQMQTLTLLLGHPIYGLTVVLFTLLLSAGIGSRLTDYLKPKNEIAWTMRWGCALVLILAAGGILTQVITPVAQAQPTPVRVAIAVALLFPIGLALGTAFPVGMKLASNKSYAHTPLLWGLNGASSV